MKNIFIAGALAALSLFAAGFAQAGVPELQAGQVLPGSLVAQTASAPIGVGARRYRVLSTAGDGEAAVSTVVDERGVVGHSRNELVISEFPAADAQSLVDSLQLGAVSARYYEQLKLTSLRFASFAEAAQAHDKLASVLPRQAKLTVPVQFSETTLR